MSDHTQAQQYVATLARLIETRKLHEGSEDGQKDADIAIRRMKASVVKDFGEAAWAALERAALEDLDKSPPPAPRRGALRRTKSGLYLA